MATDRPKSGVDLGVVAINPVDGRRIPVWASDYVLADYGTGAIMAVPGQDQRDWDFAKAFDLPIIRTVEPPGADFDRGGDALLGSGTGDQLGQREVSVLNGLAIAEAKSAMIEWLKARAPAGGR